MPLTTGPSRAKGITIHYRVLIESAVNESRSRNFLFPYCRKICEVTKARKCNPSQPLRSAYFGQRTSERNFRSVCIILYTYSNLFLCTSFIVDEL